MESVTLDQLIVNLQNFKRSRGLTGDELVVVGSNYGDRSNTIQAISLNERPETATLCNTCYSESGYKINENEPEEGEEAVIVLNYENLF